jgi:hypothetical protein
MIWGGGEEGVPTEGSPGRYLGDFMDGKPHGKGTFNWNFTHDR